jgi:hypothetical protein
VPSDSALHLPRRWGQLAVALLLLFFLAWDLRAVLTDGQIAHTDTTIEDAVLCRKAVRVGGAAGFLQWAHENRKGPLAGPLVMMLDVVFDDTLVAARMLGVLLHGLLLWLVCHLARRLSGRWSCGVLALVLTGTYCGVYGWFRLEFHDSLLTVLTLATLWRMTLPINRVTAGLQLGLMVGLGLLSKMAFPVFIGLPGLWFLYSRVRDRRSLIGLGVAALVAACITAWWLIPALQMLSQYASISTEPFGHGWLTKLWGYSVDIPGSGPFLALALIGAWVASRSRTVAGAQMVPFALFIIGGAFALVFVFVKWPRYIVPLYPAAGLLVAVMVVSLVERAARRWSPKAVKVVSILLLVGLLGRFCYDNIVGLPSPHNARDVGVGLVAPDTRPYLAYPKMVTYLRAKSLTVVDLPNVVPLPVTAVWQRRGYHLPGTPPHEAERAVRRHSKPFLTLFYHPPDTLRPIFRDGDFTEQYSPALRRALRRWRKVVLKSYDDPGGLRVSLVRLQP